MANNVTEGAIVQHLAKLRIRRVDKGKEVPPPLRRGGVGAATSSKSQEPPVTPVSPQQSSENAGTRRTKQNNEPKSRGEKRAASEDEYDSSSDSDKEWSATRRTKSTKKGKLGRSLKKRKSTPPKYCVELDIDVNDGSVASDVADEPIAASQDAEMVAVGAEFLDFVSNKQKEESRATPVSEDNDQVDEARSLIVKLRLGAKNLQRLKHKGIGVYQDRDPEQRWQLPSPGPNGEKWGFSKDYYGPVPTSGQNPQNPGLLRGEWPLDVAMRQYDAPQAVKWANETHGPDPRLVHPAKYLEKPECAPQLKLHRKLRPIEENNPKARVRDQERPAYQAYVNTHRELPAYYNRNWNFSPSSISTPKPGDGYNVQDFSANNGVNLPTTAAQSQSLLYQQGDFSSFNFPHLQTEDGTDTHEMLDVKPDMAIGDDTDHHSELPMGKDFDVDRMLDQDVVEEAKNMIWS